MKTLRHTATRTAAGVRTTASARTLAGARAQVPAAPFLAAHLTTDTGGLTLNNVTRDANGLFINYQNNYCGAWTSTINIPISFAAPFYSCLEWTPGFSMAQAGTAAAVVDLTGISTTLWGASNHILLNDFGVSTYGPRAGMFPQIDQEHSAIPRSELPNFIAGDVIRQVYAFDPSRGTDLWTSIPAYAYYGHLLDASGGGMTSVFENVAPVYFGVGTLSNNGLTASLHAREYVMAQGWPAMDVNGKPAYLADPVSYINGMLS